MAINLNDANYELNTIGVLKITDQEIAYLQSFLDRGDRGGYYMALYNITGNTQALQQAQIATFSEGLGGTAFLANFLLQNGLPQGAYPGIYYLSKAVAEESLKFIRDKLDPASNTSNTNTGYLTDQEIFDSAATAWRERWKRDDAVNGKDVERYFPGNLLAGFKTTGDILAAFSLPALPGAELVLNTVGRILAEMFRDNQVRNDVFVNRLLTEGADAGFLGFLGAPLLGKKLADYESNPTRYAIYELPDAKYKIAVDKQTNNVVGVFDITWLPLSTTELFNSIASNAYAILGTLAGGIPAGVTAALITNFLNGFLGDFHRMLSETNTGFNGDVNPLMRNPDYSVVQDDYLTTSTGTPGNDTLWGKGGWLTFFHADRLDGGAGDDRIFGGDGGDTLNGGEGADIVYGQGGSDTLYGDGGNDVLRGGKGDDALYGGLGDDLLDGEDVNPNTPGGSDRLYGGDGNDILTGGKGNDILEGGFDNDDILGGVGNDTYYYHAGDGNDQILDSDGQGRIVFIDTEGKSYTLSAGQRKSTDPAGQYRDVKLDSLTFTKSGNDLIVQIPGGGTITIKEYQAGNLGIRLIDLPAEPTADTATGPSYAWGVAPPNPPVSSTRTATTTYVSVGGGSATATYDWPPAQTVDEVVFKTEQASTNTTTNNQGTPETNDESANGPSLSRGPRLGPIGDVTSFMERRRELKVFHPCYTSRQLDYSPRVV